MTCMAMALCVSCKKDNDDEPTGGGNVGVSGTIAGHDYVDLGLPSGLLWATCNIGAYKPEDYGNYYAWGETETKSDYDWDTYKWCNGKDYKYKFTKYCTNPHSGTVDNKTVLDLEDDAAHVNWGGAWRMPTHDEMKELNNNCTWTLTTQGGKEGYRATGPNGNSIFLPNAGSYSFENYYADGALYWSSSLKTDDDEFAYTAFTNASGSMGYIIRIFGQSVRPVCPSQK